MKKIKCIKCGLRFKDREEPEDFDKTLCWNCRFILQCIRATLQSLSSDSPLFRRPLNREVIINLDNIVIIKRKKND